MNTRTILASIILCFGLSDVAGAEILFTEAAALETMFPDVADVTPHAVVLTEDQLQAVKDQLGGKWTIYKAGSTEAQSEGNDSVQFFFAMKDGEKTGVALIEEQPGKWGPVKYIVAMDLTGKVTNLAVMSYSEKRGKPIASRRFLEQFVGKTADSPLTVGKDVDAISGATISSRATAFAVKKVVTLYRTVYLSGAEEQEG